MRVFHSIDAASDRKKCFYILTCNMYEYMEYKRDFISQGYIEFDDFVWYQLYKKKVCLISANCHGLVLAQYLSSNHVFNDSYGIYPISMMPVVKKSNMVQDDNLLEHVDLLIYQKIKKENPLGVSFSDEYILNKVNENCRRFCMPNLFGIGAGLFPYQTKKIYKYNQEDMFYQDVLLEEAFEHVKEKTVQDIISYIEDKEPDLDMQKRVYQESLEEMKRREQHWDIKLSGYFLKSYRHIPMFNDIGHPSKYFMLEFVKRTCDALGFSMEADDAATADETFLKSFNFGLYGIIHKPVKEVLGLRYVQDYLEVRKRIRVDAFSGDLNYREVSIIEFIRAYFFVSKGIVLDKKQSIANKISQFKEEREKILRDIVPDRNYLKVAIPQSELFMMDIIPVIHERYMNLPENAWKSCLDVGADTLGGTALLQKLHSPETFTRLKLKVSALDIMDRYSVFQKLVAPDVEFLVQDVFSIKGRSWDFIICSHVIEHLEKPKEFLKQLQCLAKDFVIVSCPYNENPLTTRGHINTISEGFIRDVGGEDLRIITNYSWGKKRSICTFVLPGKCGDANIDKRDFQNKLISIKPVYEFNGQNSEDAVLVLLLHQLGVDISLMKYLEIGINDPKYGNPSYILYQLGARGVMVDPLIEQYKSRIDSLRPKDDVAAAAITGRAEKPTVKFYVPPEKVTHSSLNKSLAEKWGDVKEIEVPLVGINELMSAVKSQAGFVPDLMLVNVEGEGDRILNSLDYDSYAPTVIMAETSQSKLSECVQFMASKGYTYYCTIRRANSIFFRGNCHMQKSTAE